MSKAEFLNELSELMEMPAGSLQGDERLSDLENWNSMAVMGFIALADEKLGVRVAPRQIANCDTVTDLAKLAGVTG